MSVASAYVPVAANLVYQGLALRASPLDSLLLSRTRNMSLAGRKAHTVAWNLPVEKGGESIFAHVGSYWF